MPSKAFIVETVNEISESKLREFLYHSPCPSGYTIKEITDTEGRMSFLQREALWNLCCRYNVPFREDDYSGPFRNEVPLKGWVEGWVGGRPGTIYVGVDPYGRIHS